MTEKRDLGARLAARLNIPLEALPSGFGLSMIGDGELTVRGCKRILSYGETCISLAVGKRVLTVMGTALFCTAFSGGAVTIRGRISGLDLGGDVRA